LNGWLLSEFDGFPSPGDVIERYGYRFLVESMDTEHRRIGSVLIEPLPREGEREGGENS